MNKKQLNEFEDFAFEIKHNRDYYSRAWIIETLVKKAATLVNKTDLLPDVINWVAYDFDKIETRPPEYGKYLICRKDGKIHWETWNGSGWAYNHTVIRYWAIIKPPCL